MSKRTNVPHKYEIHRLDSANVETYAVRRKGNGQLAGLITKTGDHFKVELEMVFETTTTSLEAAVGWVAGVGTVLDHYRG